MASAQQKPSFAPGRQRRRRAADPRARPRDRPNPLTVRAVARVHSSARRGSFDLFRADGSRDLFRSTASRGFTDQGLEKILLPASLATIARDQSFAPTRSARAPPVTRPSRPGLGNPCRWEQLQKRNRSPLSPARQTCVCRALRAASRCSPRRESRYAAPEVPSTDSRLPEGG